LVTDNVSVSENLRNLLYRCNFFLRTWDWLFRFWQTETGKPLEAVADDLWTFWAQVDWHIVRSPFSAASA
jgi:hypothetical protein